MIQVGRYRISHNPTGAALGDMLRMMGDLNPSVAGPINTLDKFQR